MTVKSLQYERIKNFILDNIDGGHWESGVKIPSENQLADQFSLSRMTVNRAVKELEAAGVVERLQGKGTYVAPPRPLRSVLQIQGIDEEVIARGNTYSCQVLQLQPEPASEHVSSQLEVSPGSKVWSSSILHLENGSPIQLEKRWVRTTVCNDYIEQDFTKQTPHHFLMSRAPFTKGEHIVEACVAQANIKKLLKLEHNEACLLIHRRTWIEGSVASYVQLFHPGKRFRLTAILS